jgi:hypothetical protein
MSTVQEIEAAIERLSREQLDELCDWLSDFAADAWDRQIEADAASGKLNAMYQRLEKENQDEANIPLDDFLNKEKLS